MSDWPDPAVDYVQAVADTKLVLGHRLAQWTLAGPSLEDNIGGASGAQEEIGHVRQLFRLLQRQGRDAGWLEGDRQPAAFANAASLDAIGGEWPTYLCTVGPTDRAAWYLLDAIDHPDFDGMLQKMGEDEYFHLEYYAARLETLADEEPETVQSTLESVVPDMLAFLGPAAYDGSADPLLDAGFTDRSVAEIREAYLAHYRDLFDGTDVSLSGVDAGGPALDDWDETRRRVGDGAIDGSDLEQLQGVRNREFAIE